MNPRNKASQRYLIVPIGPSGSGKSTLFNTLQDKYPDLKSFSWDTLRHEWYDPKDYSRAWQLASKDKTFYDKALNQFRQMVRNGDNIYVDNINISPKSRRQFVEVAKSADYRTVAYVLEFDMDTLLERQRQRADKFVPVDAVQRQAASVIRPISGEFDEVHNVNTAL